MHYFEKQVHLNKYAKIQLRGSLKEYVDNVAPLQIICHKLKINTLYLVKTFILWVSKFSLQLVVDTFLT
jgi:hypothetical protein